MSFIKSYLSVLNEDTKKNSSVAADNTGELEGAEKAKKFVKDSGPEAVKEVEKPVKGPHSEQDSESLPQAVKSESKNPFDLLYNKILSEEAFEDNMDDMSGDTLDFEGEIEDNAGDDLGLEVSEDEDEEHESEEKEGLEAVLDHLKSAVSSLESFLSSEEHEDEEHEDEDSMDMDMDMDMEDEVPVSEEAVEAEIEGHALVDQEKLEKGLTKHSNQQVKGAVPVSKKKAEVVKGKKVTGKPEPFHTNPEELVNKSRQNVGGVTVGKSLFDQ
ncbi:hypothetical protein EBU91_03230 [bacterium]|nr:hypothetical protein [bacterium]